MRKKANKNVIYFLFLFVSLGILACEKDEPKGVQTEENPGETDNNDSGDNDTAGNYEGASAVYIINEGTANYGNASLTEYKLPDKEVFREVFRNQNGRPLGDVFQSMFFFNNRAYLVVNKSGKIEGVHSKNFQSKGTIKGLPSPRYLMALSDGTGYVSNFTLGNQSEISIVDLNTYQKIDAIKTGGWTEQQVLANGLIWVAEVDLGALLVIDPAKDAIMDTLRLQKQVKEVVKDRQGKLWTLSNGGLNNEHKPILYRINPVKRKIMEKYFFKKNTQPSDLTFNKAKDTLYFLKDGIYRMSINAIQLPSKPLVKEKGDRNFYGLGVDPFSGRIFASDALDYVQRGLVFTYSSGEGNAIDTLKAGIIPRKFIFVK